MTTDNKGRFTATFQIPMTDPYGQCVITATGKAVDGNVRVDSVMLTISPP